MNEIEAAVVALGAGPLEDQKLRRHIDPLFSRVLRDFGERIYLANHSLGRPLDCTEKDVLEGLGFWYSDLDEAWASWQAEMLAFRSRVAQLINAEGAHCIVPKTSAGQGLRAVLNRHYEPIRVIATRSEFSSIDLILKAYEAHGRIHIHWVHPNEQHLYGLCDFTTALQQRADLLVLSLVFFDTGRSLADIGSIVSAAKAQGVEVLLDLYHAAGALPVDVTGIGIDFAIGGSYKYLRGGPGSAWLYVHPQHLDQAPRTLDTGWFATSEPFAFERPERLSFARGANGWLKSTPAILPFYQARAGLEFTLAIGVERLRAYSLAQQAILIECLDKYGITALAPDEPHGAFLAIPHPKGQSAAAKLLDEGVIADAREGLATPLPGHTEFLVRTSASRRAHGACATPVLSVSRRHRELERATSRCKLKRRL